MKQCFLVKKLSWWFKLKYLKKQCFLNISFLYTKLSPTFGNQQLHYVFSRSWRIFCAFFNCFVSWFWQITESDRNTVKFNNTERINTCFVFKIYTKYILHTMKFKRNTKNKYFQSLPSTVNDSLMISKHPNGTMHVCIA